MRILVCDDLPERCSDALAAIDEAHLHNVTVQTLIGEDLKRELESLFDAIALQLDGDNNAIERQGTAFDSVDLLILDNNLAHLSFRGSRLTAEVIAGYIRAFTAAPYLVSLNKNTDVDFDLRYLIGDYETRADIALNTDHLANTGLWTGDTNESKTGFLPWYWPALVEMPDKRRAQIEFIKGKLNSPVLQTFGFKNDAIEFLSRHAKGALSPNARSDSDTDEGVPDIREITFRDVFRDGNRSIPDKAERALLLERQSSGDDGALESVARVVAADIDRWFRLDVLGPEEALVDAPHLVGRMPFLLGSSAADVMHWNASAASRVGPFGMEQELYTRFVKPARFLHDLFVLRPCFWWSELRENEALNKLFASSSAQWADVAFCEDISRFQNREHSREFVAQIEGPWDRRHVAYNPEFKYAPRSRFAL